MSTPSPGWYAWRMLVSGSPAAKTPTWSTGDEFGWDFAWTCGSVGCQLSTQGPVASSNLFRTSPRGHIVAGLLPEMEAFQNAHTWSPESFIASQTRLCPWPRSSCHPKAPVSMGSQTQKELWMECLSLGHPKSILVQSCPAPSPLPLSTQEASNAMTRSLVKFPMARDRTSLAGWSTESWWMSVFRKETQDRAVSRIRLIIFATPIILPSYRPLLFCEIS
jgi:hypothetical protein